MGTEYSCHTWGSRVLGSWALDPPRPPTSESQPIARLAEWEAQGPSHLGVPGLHCMDVARPGAT